MNHIWASLFYVLLLQQFLPCLLRHWHFEVPRLITEACSSVWLCLILIHWFTASAGCCRHTPTIHVIHCCQAVTSWGAQSPFAPPAVPTLISLRRLCQVPLRINYYFLLPYNLLIVALICITFNHSCHIYLKLESFINLLGIYLFIFRLLPPGILSLFYSFSSVNHSILCW